VAPFAHGRFIVGRADATQAPIVKALETMGINVQDLSPVGDGCPDLLCGIGSVLFLIEVKVAKGKLREKQIEWRAKWSRVPYYVVRTVAEAIELGKIMRRNFLGQ